MAHVTMRPFARGDLMNAPHDWEAIDRRLRRLAHTEAKLDIEVGRWLLEGERAALHEHDLMAAYTSRPAYQQNDYLGSRRCLTNCSAAMFT